MIHHGSHPPWANYPPWVISATGAQALRDHQQQRRLKARADEAHESRMAQLAQGIDLFLHGLKCWSAKQMGKWVGNGWGYGWAYDG